MLKSLLRESIDKAQIPRGVDRTPPGLDPQARPPLIVTVDSDFDLDAGQASLSEADAILIRVAEPSGLRRACAAVCRCARRGQTIVLASPGYLGATRALLIDPLLDAGFRVGEDICVACSPEPAGAGAGKPVRVLGAVGPLCGEKARLAIEPVVPAVQIVSSPEAAELTRVLGEATAAAIVRGVG
jgi:UDP-N-acetyl-D-glucosamine dehydrogenase